MRKWIKTALAWLVVLALCLQGLPVIAAGTEDFAPFVPLRQQLQQQAREPVTLLVALDDGALEQLEQMEGVTVLRTYDTLVQGAEVTVPATAAPQIAALEGVEAVQLSRSHAAAPVEAPGDTALPTACRGTGLVAAVIGGGVDTAAFSGTPAGAKLTRDVVSARQTALGFHAQGNVYVSGKIPFSYNYSTRTPDTAGTSDAKVLAASVPDVQLAVMQAYTDGDLLAALEDSVKLGVDVIYLGLAIPGGTASAEPLMARAFYRLADAGISIVAPAGTQTQRGDQPDNGLVAAPGTYPEALSVAVGNASGMSADSAWGPTSDLSMKPELTAPSASSAAAGLLQVEQYLQEKYPDMTAYRRRVLAEQLLLSTAQPIPGVSPRRQGSGVMDVEKALCSTGYLAVSGSARPLAALGENEQGQFAFTFYLYNTGDTPATYALSAQTMAEQLGNDAVPLTLGDVTVTMPKSVTVYPGSRVRVDVTIALTNDALADHFLTGFVYAQGETALSLPFLGYYGDWEKDSLFDATLYDGAAPKTGASGLYMMGPDLYYPIGTNLLIPDGVFDRNRLAVPQNQAGQFVLQAQMYLLRNAKRVDFSVIDGANTAIFAQTLTGVARSQQVNGEYTHADFTWDWSGAASGPYTCAFTGYLGEEPADTLKLPLYVDGQAPELADYTVETRSGKTTLTVDVTDDHCIMGVQLISADGNYVYSQPVAVDKASAQVALDITSLVEKGLSTAALYLVDYAMNERYSQPIDLETGIGEPEYQSIPDCGSYTVSKSGAYQLPKALESYDHLTVTVEKSAGNVTIAGNGAELPNVQIRCAGDVNLTLWNVQTRLTGDAPEQAGILTFATGRSTLIVRGKNSLMNTRTGVYPAIAVPQGATVTFRGSGSLTAENQASANSGAVIGGAGNAHVGTMIFESGSYTAATCGSGAAIGTGFAQHVTPATARLEIRGGTVTATTGAVSPLTGQTASAPGAGIGTASGSICGMEIVISSGTVTATTHGAGAAIGTGARDHYTYYPVENNAATSVTVTGGTVTATASGSGAAMGGGGGASGVTAIAVSGGNVTVSATGSGAAMGSGDSLYCDTTNITLSGGVVTATASGSGAAIGGGGEKQETPSIQVGTLRIYNTSVLARSTGSGAAIGQAVTGKAAQPVDQKGTKTFPVTLSAPGYTQVEVDGTLWNLTGSHGADTSLYLYLTPGSHTAVVTAGETITRYTFTVGADGAVAFGNRPVSATSTRENHTITYHLENIAHNGILTAEDGTDVEILLTPAPGCTLPETVAVTGSQSILCYSFNPELGRLTVYHVTGELTLGAAGEAVTPVDKTALEEMVKAAQALDPAEYNETSFHAMEAVLSDALAMLADDTARQADLDALALALQKAMDSLIPLGPAYFTITVDWHGEGTVTPSGALSVQEGQNVTLAFRPALGYHVHRVEVDGAPVVAAWNYTFENVTENHTLTVWFDGPCDGGEGCPSAHFTDVDPARWYHYYVDRAVELELMKGMSSTTFEPDRSLTRGMLVTMLYRMAGKPPVSDLSDFPDVPQTAYFAIPIAWAQQVGIVTGYTDGTFGPWRDVTRGEMVTMIHRYSMAVDGKPDNTPEENLLAAFPDWEDTRNYARPHLNWAIQEGLINGVKKGNTSYLMPNDLATRAQAAKVLLLYLGY